MNENIRSTNLRFNLDKDIPNRAWEYLQTMDRQHFKSYNQVIALAIVDYFERYYRGQEDPYLETREREERFIEQIVASVEKAMEKTLPVFLSGCMAGLYQGANIATPIAGSEPEPEMEVDWDFLGG